MQTPKSLEPLLRDGLIDEVIRPLKSGKEASVYVVRSGSDIRCAKVYKEANQRSFRQAAQYTEGRKVRNSRRARAMEKGTRYGRKEQEESWQTPKWMPCIGWPPRACVCPSPIVSSMAYC